MPVEKATAGPGGEATAARVAAVVIGRNEGARLAACLDSLAGEAGCVVYVDSGSADGSAALARARGAQVVELDPALPFTAARGRNEGFARLDRLADAGGAAPEFVQFVDGDCRVEPGWIGAGAACLAAEPGLAIVTGWRREVHPRANAFHAMAGIEWHQPAGPISACGGDMMVRATAFRAAGGFDAAIIASEDEDFVQRVLKTGAGALRLPRVMTHHDIAMTRLSQFWRRHLRTGNGFAEVGARHPPHFRRERQRALAYGGLLPLALLAGLVTGLWWLWLPPPAIWGLNLLRNWRWLRRTGLPAGLALRVAGLFVFAKLPQFIGMLRFHLHRLRRAGARNIDYK